MLASVDKTNTCSHRVWTVDDMSRCSVRGMTEQRLNRALLARQGLLDRIEMPLVDAVEAVGALQAQRWAALPVALWSRVRDFSSAELYAGLQRRELVVGTLLRNTLHLVSAREHPA